MLAWVGGGRDAGDVEAGNLCAVFGEQGGRGAAQIAPAAGDDRGLAGDAAAVVFMWSAPRNSCSLFAAS